MRNRRRLVSTDDGLQHIWPSFTDVTSTFAIILFVLVLLAYIRNLISGQRLDAYQARIAASEQSLRTLEAKLARTSAEIAAGQSRLLASEQKLQAQEALVLSSNAELTNLRARLSGIAVFRVEVLNKVKLAIEGVLGGSGRANLVSIGDNGNIVINEGLVFEYNSFAIKPESGPLLDTLSKALQNVLDDAGVRENVDVIVVQGHTDERGSTAFNRDLSAKRANAVLDYLFSVNPTLEGTYGSYFASSAYSEFRPLDAAHTEAAYDRNRRIEIAVVLKDAQVRKVIDEYTQGLTAAPAVPPSGGPAAPP
jgi:chemotaxis protein MotB